MNFTHCPLCKDELTIETDETATNKWCSKCLNKDMEKFRVTYSPDGYHIKYALWWLGNHYIEFDYVRKTTTVTSIDVCVRRDPVIFQRLLDLDPENPGKLERRLDTLMYYS